MVGVCNSQFPQIHIHIKGAYSERYITDMADMVSPTVKGSAIIKEGSLPVHVNVTKISPLRGAVIIIIASNLENAARSLVPVESQPGDSFSPVNTSVKIRGIKIDREFNPNVTVIPRADGVDIPVSCVLNVDNILVKS